jgi:hypothetical protein
MRYSLRTLLIALAMIAALLAAGVLRMNQRRGLGGVIRDLKRVAPQIEQHNQEVHDLASP